MRRTRLVLAIVLAGCAAPPVADDVSPTTSTSVATSTTLPATTITMAPPFTVGGEFVRIDPVTLEPLPGYQPVAFAWDSWNLSSDDGSYIINFEWDDPTETSIARVLDVEAWAYVSEFVAQPDSGRGVIAGDTYYAYVYPSGELVATDLRTGTQQAVAQWPAGDSWVWNRLSADSSRVAGLVGDGTGDYSLLVHDESTGESVEYDVGALEIVNEESGVFDGDEEIPEVDSPAVLWTEGSVLIVHFDGPTVTEVDIGTGELRVHEIDTSTWLERLLEFWMPGANAKGYQLGTSTSAELSVDGTLLYLGGSEFTVEPGGYGLVEQRKPLGVLVIDTTDWTLVEKIDLPIEWVFESEGGVVIGVSTISTTPWLQEFYVLGPEPRRIPVPEGFESCFEYLAAGYLHCHDYESSGQTITVLDLESFEVVSTKTIGDGDNLEPPGVLVDWRPPVAP